MSLDGLKLEAALGQPRAIGAARVSARLRGGRSVIGDLRQSGSAKLLFPRNAARRAGAPLEAVILNTAGGVTGGDRFEWRATAEAGATLILSTQAAERAYRAQPHERGAVHTRLAVEAGATLMWLPQETILYDRAALSRRLDVDLAPDARFLALEPIVFGRAASGERLRALRFSDQWRVRRDGRLVYADAIRLEGDAVAALSGPGALAGMGAMASLVLIAPDAAALLAPLRALAPAGGAAIAGVSLIRDGALAARVAASDGFALRRALIPMVEALAARPLPTVWKL